LVIAQITLNTPRNDFAQRQPLLSGDRIFFRDLDDVFVILAPINSPHGCFIIGSSVNRGSSPHDGPPTP